MNHSSIAHCLALGLVPLALGLGTGGRNLLKNGDFEKFTGNEPAGWETTNIPPVLTIVSPSTKSHGGKLAVKCEVKDFSGTKMAGMVCKKDVPVSGTALRIKGYFLLHSVGKDVGFLSISFKNENKSAIGSLEEVFSTADGDYRAFARESPVPETTASMDLHCTLLAGKGSSGLHEGSYLLMDDLEIVSVAEPIQ